MSNGVLSVLDRSTPTIVRSCWCGWSPRTHSDGRARARWQIHLMEHRCADRAATVVGLGMAAAVRTDDLRQRRDALRARREDLRARRVELRRAAAAAETYAQTFRVPAWRLLDRARQMAGMDRAQLWMAYFALGGSTPPPELHAMISGEAELGHHDAAVLVVALNEAFEDVGLGRPLLHRGGCRVSLRTS